MMRLVSLHLSNDRILWGHVLLEDTENPDAHLAQILVRHIDVEPGTSSTTSTTRSCRT